LKAGSRLEADRGEVARGQINRIFFHLNRHNSSS
jgi:hypothetical protein